MRKTFIWALMAAFVVSGAAIAAPGRIQSNATFDTADPGVGPATTNNDDTCDISTAPAATLLLPYFEVDISQTAGRGENTIFTITNTSDMPAIAHVTLWTDYSFPVIDFNVYLTGYDVQSINLFDVINDGKLPATGPTKSDVGALSDVDNPLIDDSRCDSTPTQLGTAYITRMQQAFTEGSIPALGGADSCDDIGGVHDNAVGYATVDIASACTTTLPTDPDYAETTLLYDNWLIGDYLQIDGDNDFAQGNPMVHIRAIPEGGVFGDATTNFDRTFYSRYQAGLTDDRRQPLPALFAARWIDGGPGSLQTNYKIWREGTTGSDAGCDVSDNAELAVTEFTRFDESENPSTVAPGDVVSPPITPGVTTLPETSLTSVSDTDTFPTLDTEDVGGWMYMNLDNDSTDDFASQNWVVVSMRSEGRYSVDFDAAWLGNGCTPPTGPSEAADDGNPPIGPAANFTPDNPDLPPAP